MLSTPKSNRFRPSLGEPSRVPRWRVQSPGASSVESLENNQSTASPRRWAAGHVATGSGSVGSRHGHIPRGTPSGRSSRDPRPVGDRAFAAQCARNVVEVLNTHGYGKAISHEKLLKDPSTKEFFDVFRFLVAQLDPQLEIEGKMEDEIPSIMRRLKYPVEVNRSKLQAISGPNTLPQLLAVLDWLAMLIQINAELIEPVATCQFGLADIVAPDQEGGDHQLLHSLHENYMQFLGGKCDHSDEDRLRQIYDERIEALRGEIERLRAQHASMGEQLNDFRSEHDRLLELQKAPVHFELEVNELRGVIQAQEARVQDTEEMIALAEAEEHAFLGELNDAQATLEKLTEQVERQAYSKNDIERLKCERGQLRQILQDLRVDVEKAEQNVWELGMQESSQVDIIGRLVRRTNESVEALEHTLVTESGLTGHSLIVQVNVDEPSDALAAQDFEELRSCVQASIISLVEAAQSEEAAMHDVIDEQRVVQEELSEKDRECRRLKVRLEQLNRMREEYRVWSSAQLDDAQRTTETTEDAVHSVSIGATGPSLRDAAEIDKLRLMLNAVRAQGANQKAQLQERIKRDGERLEEHRQRVIGELGAFVSMTETLCEGVEAAAAGKDDPCVQACWSLGAARCGGS